ncbi:magnesium transporter CorA family protein [Actinoplanes subglobosus]|uniref:Magnesium transporter CorA family protein n=1 Tax=Actinoplanes subglobosus TaxID=1547892 RepID=A0ABV8IKC7_9ACTN
MTSRLYVDEPGTALWYDLDDPSDDELAALATRFGLHPLAVEDALQEHERPKLDHYENHMFLNVYAVEFDHEPRKTEISAFITPEALITVHRAPFDMRPVLDRWADGDRPPGGVDFLVYALLDLVADTQYRIAQRIDEAMDSVEDRMLGDGPAPRDVRRHGFTLRRHLAALRRAAAPMPEVARSLAADGDLKPYYRDVEDHARLALDLIEHSRIRITELLDDDLAEQSNELNVVTRKLAAWAAIIAIPTALTGYFGQNLPYPGYEQWWGWVVSTVLIVLTAGGLYLYLKRRNWL